MGLLAAGLAGRRRISGRRLWQPHERQQLPSAPIWTTICVLGEPASDNQVSFIGQANLLATYRLNYQWTSASGYQFLFVDGVALASENFNPRTARSTIRSGPRSPLINDNGNVFYHGWNIGLEYMW